MNPKSTNSMPINNGLSRCLHRTPTGRRCRFPVAEAASSYCLRHAALHQENLDSLNLAPALLGELTEIVTAMDMQRVLGKLFILLAQNRITTKKAAVLTYIIQQLLRTLPEVEHELNSQSDPSAAPAIIVDIPRPSYEQANQPS